MSLASAVSGFSSLGGRARDGVVTAGEMTSLAVEAVVSIVTDIISLRFSWTEFLLQMWFMLRVSLIPTMLVSIPFGVIISVTVGSVSAQIGASSFAGAINGIGSLRQAAPLVTSLMIAGVIGSAITSDLGARTVREEIDALKVMGISPVQRLVSPRILAALCVSMILTFFVAATSMLTAYVMNVGTGIVSSGAYNASFSSFSQPLDLAVGEFKALVFGFLATVVASHKGLSAKGGPKGVADAVNQAVVLSVVLLSVTNVLITQGYVMFFDSGPA